MGQASTVSVTLTNTESVRIVVSAASVSGSGFSISGLALPATIRAGRSHSFTVRFQPVAAGAVTGSISFTDNAPGSPQVLALSATGVSPNSTLNASSTSVAFGNVPVGSSASQSIALTNAGTASITISQASAAGSGFSLTGLTLPVSLAGGQSVSFAAQFAPATTGNVSGSITITNSASDPALTIALSGTGAQGVLAAAPSSASFGNVALGTSSSQAINLSNTGNASLTITQASVAGGGFSASGFSVPFTIAAGGTASFKVAFAPTAAGAASGSVSIASTASNPTMAIALSGTGAQGQVAATPSTVSFGNVVTGNSNSQPVKLSNTGNASLTITQANVTGAGFSASGLSMPLTIAAGASASFNVAFAPAAAGSVNGSMAIVSNASNASFSLPISGAGVQAATLLGANPTSLNFGNVNDGSSSTLNATLTNNGNSNVTISGVSASGTGFSASGVASGLILGPGQSATLQVAFNPASAGSVSGNVAVSSNATNSPLAISLAGTGIQMGPNSVSLTWTASSSSNLAGYYVYRGTTQGAYSKLNSTPVADVDYTDSTVQSGANTTYYYVVTAVDSNNVESTDSNVASALVP